MSYGHQAPKGNPPRASFECVECGKIASYGGTSWSEPCPGPGDLSKRVNTNMFSSLQLQQMEIFRGLMKERDDLLAFAQSLLNEAGLAHDFIEVQNRARALIRKIEEGT